MEHDCGVCKQKRTEGFYLFDLFICSACEQEIVHTPPESPSYQKFIDELRVIQKPKQYS